MKKVFCGRLLIFALIFAFFSTLLLALVEERSEFPRASGYPVSLFIEPDDGREPIIEAMRLARESIDLICYLLSDRPILEELTAASRRGVKVRVILEREPYGRSRVNYRAKKILEAAGIHFKWAHSEFVLTHAKIILIDKKKALVMNLNLCKSAFEKNREYGVVIEDPDIVKELDRIFEADWNRRNYQAQEPNLVISPQNSRAKILALIKRAKERIWLQHLLFEDGEIKEALAEAARRGVEVRVLLADPTKVEENLITQRFLNESKAEVRFQYQPHLHAKFISFDGQICFIGSQNLSGPSLDLNREIGILLTDKESISRLEETFLSDWQRAK